MKRQRSSRLPSTPVLLALTALAAGYLGYRLRAGREPLEDISTQEIALQKARGSAISSDSLVASRGGDVALAAARSGLDMISRGGAPSRASGSTQPPASYQARGFLRQAADAFISLQKSAKYRQSRVVQAWASDFLAYPDLRAINRKYWQDRDARAFVIAVLQSNNFAKMIRRYVGAPEIQGFFRDWMAAPGATNAWQFLRRDPSVSSAVAGFRIPGFPSIGELEKMGSQGYVGPEQLLPQLKTDPVLGGILASQNPPARAPSGTRRKR